MEYYASPIPSLMDGLLKGVTLGHSIVQARQQAAQFKTQQALDNQRLSMNDILNTQFVQSQGRPVGPGGTISQPGTSTTLPNPSTPAIAGNLGDDNQAATPPIPAMQLPDSLQGTIQQPGYVRKADPKRVVTYQDRYGNKTQTELYTPEEQAQRALSDALQKRYIGSTWMSIPQELRDKYNTPAQIPVPNEHIAGYLQTIRDMMSVPTPQRLQDFGYPATMPQKDLPSIMSAMTGFQNRMAADTRSQNQIKSQQQIAEENRKSRESIAAQAQAGQTARTQAQIQGRETVAGMPARNAGLTPGQANVQSRYEQAQLNAKQKKLDTLQGQENKLHASRVQLGKMMQGLDPTQMPGAQAKMAGFNQQIQDIQAQKATAIGAKVPSREQLQQIQEGETRPAPDGHIWKKKDGIVYLVK